MSEAVTQNDLELECGPLVAGGDALVRRPGEKTVFVEGAITGELVRARVTNDRKDLIRAQTVEVLRASPERVEAPCPVFHKGCGGCQWQHIKTDAQHQHKVQMVNDSLTRIAKREDFPISFGGAVSDFQYRTTMRVAVEDGHAALRQRHTNDLVSLDLCLIAHPLLEEMVKEGDFGDATEVTLRVSATSGERMAWVRGDAGTVKLPKDVMITSNGRDAAVHETVAGHRFRISARSFFQSGHGAAELLAQTVAAAVPEDAGWIVDAYAGVGLLSFVVGEDRDGQLTLIEKHKPAVLDARYNLRSLAAEVIEAEVATVALPGESRPDAVIADPSRTGLGKSASKALADLGAETFVLVSCDPASMARDVNLLTEAGYDLKTVTVLDLYPQTHHVETVSTFAPR